MTNMLSVDGCSVPIPGCNIKRDQSLEEELLGIQIAIYENWLNELIRKDPKRIDLYEILLENFSQENYVNVFYMHVTIC